MEPEIRGSEARPNGPDGDRSGGGLRDLAQQRFGSLLMDRAPDDSPDPDEPALASDEAEPTSPPDPGEEPADRSEEEAGPEEAAEAAPDSDESEASSEEGFRSLDELFAAAELAPDVAGSLGVRIKVDGRESEIPLSELVAGYQIRSAAEKRLAEAKEKAKALDQELSAKSEAAEAHLAQTAKLLEQVESQLQEDTRRIDWAQLREDDKAEYSARKTEIAERRAEIDRVKREAVDSYRQSMENRQKEIAQHHQERLAQEHAALLEHLPEWRDDAKAREEKGRLAHYLLEQGFTQQDVQGAADHRLVLLARKAMLYDHGRQSAAKKKVTKPGRVLRPGTKPSSQEQQNRDRTQRALADHRRKGTVESAMRVLREKRGASHGAAHRNVRHQ